MLKSHHVYSMMGTCFQSGESTHYHVSGTWSNSDKTFKEYLTLGSYVIASSKVFSCPADPYLYEGSCDVISPGVTDLRGLAEEYGIIIPDEYWNNQPVGRHIFAKITTEEEALALRMEAAEHKDPTINDPICTIAELKTPPVMKKPEPNEILMKPYDNPIVYIYVRKNCTRRAGDAFKVSFERWDEDLGQWTDRKLISIEAVRVAVNPPYVHGSEPIDILKPSGKWRAWASMDTYPPAGKTDDSQPVEFWVGKNPFADMLEGKKLRTYLVTAENLPEIEKQLRKKPDPVTVPGARTPVTVPDLQITSFAAMPIMVNSQKRWNFVWTIRNKGADIALPSKLHISCQTQDGGECVVSGISGIYDIPQLWPTPNDPSDPSGAHNVWNDPAVAVPPGARYYLKATIDTGSNPDIATNNTMIREFVADASQFIPPEDIRRTARQHTQKSGELAPVFGAKTRQLATAPQAPPQMNPQLAPQPSKTPALTNQPLTAAPSLKPLSGPAMLDNKMVKKGGPAGEGIEPKPTPMQSAGGGAGIQKPAHSLMPEKKVIAIPSRKVPVGKAGASPQDLQVAKKGTVAVTSLALISVQTLAFMPAPLKAGTGVDVLLTFKNGGTAASTASHKYEISCIVKGGGPICPVTESTPSIGKAIPPGGTHTVTLAGIDDDAYAGTYQLTVQPKPGTKRTADFTVKAAIRVKVPVRREVAPAAEEEPAPAPISPSRMRRQAQ
jgi:hypothetical protein